MNRSQQSTDDILIDFQPKLMSAASVLVCTSWEGSSWPIPLAVVPNNLAL